MKRQLIRSAAIFAGCGAIAFALSGCIASIGGGREVTHVQPTRGQELIDLKKAKDQGVITPDEYETKRKQILER